MTSSHPESSAASATVETALDTSVVGVGTVVNGEVHARGAVRVRGRVEGRVRCSGAILVDEGGGVHADVFAASARIAGEVVGDVVAVDLVELVGGGRVTGDIRAARVVIADDATLRGTVTLRPTGSPDGTSAAPPSLPTTVRPPYLAGDGGPPPARGLAERTQKPRLFLRRAVDAAWPRPS